MDYKSSERLLKEWIKSSEGNVCIHRTNTKYDLEFPVTNKSVLGSLISHYSMVMSLDGKIRLFGGDDNERASLFSINRVRNGKETLIPGLLVVADDICGGIYAINNGFIKNASRGNVVFLPANSVTFEDLEIGHADFVHWCMTVSESNWLQGGWKTSDKNMRNLREADEYIQAKLTVLNDLRRS